MRKTQKNDCNQETKKRAEVDNNMKNEGKRKIQIGSQKKTMDETSYLLWLVSAIYSPLSAFSFTCFFVFSIQTEELQYTIFHTHVITGLVEDPIPQKKCLEPLLPGKEAATAI